MAGQLKDTFIGKYESVAAEAEAQAITTAPSGVGGPGDYIDTITIIPEATNAAAISLFDGATELSLFVAGTLPNLTPVTIKAGWRSVNSGGWTITTGALVHVHVTGRF